MDELLEPDFDAATMRYSPQEARILRGYALRPQDLPIPANARQKPQQQVAA